eukprot:COSAG02_NODE_8370_length_2596_cov_1.880256_2_plen_233_part_00
MSSPTIRRKARRGVVPGPSRRASVSAAARGCRWAAAATRRCCKLYSRRLFSVTRDYSQSRQTLIISGAHFWSTPLDATKIQWNLTEVRPFGHVLLCLGYDRAVFLSVPQSPPPRSPAAAAHGPTPPGTRPGWIGSLARGMRRCVAISPCVLCGAVCDVGRWLPTACSAVAAAYSIGVLRCGLQGTSRDGEEHDDKVVLWVTPLGELAGGSVAPADRTHPSNHMSAPPHCSNA